MKIGYITFGFTSGFTYQENMLPVQFQADGHDVLVIASDFIMDKNGNRSDVSLDNCENTEGLRLIRLRSAFHYCRYIRYKVQKMIGIEKVLEEFAPEVIVVNSMHTFDLRKLVQYKRKHEGTKLFLVSHADYYTTGTNSISLNILHRKIFRSLFGKYQNDVDKFWYITENVRKFSEEIYGIPDAKSDFLPLGGKVVAEEERLQIRKNIRNKMQISEEKLVFIQAGKMDAAKEVDKFVEVFSRIEDSRFCLLLVGTLSGDMEAAVRPFIKTDNRIQYCGWKSGEELFELLCASDIYVQPGKVSAILQNALCASLPVLSKWHEDYEDCVQANGWLVKSTDEITSILGEISEEPAILEKMRLESRAIAMRRYDYGQIAQKIYDSV